LKYDPIFQLSKRIKKATLKDDEYIYSSLVPAEWWNSATDP
jgi:hypothetical protein